MAQGADKNRDPVRITQVPEADGSVAKEVLGAYPRLGHLIAGERVPDLIVRHGEQWQHPVILGDKIILPPYDFDLHTGQKGNYELTRGGHGCGGLSASSNYLFARGRNPRIYEIHNGDEEGTPLTLVNRPGCWINIIPAGGLVSIPESSSGCTCGYPIQTSFVFVPR